MDDKKKLIRQYYMVLITVLLAYIIVAYALMTFNVINIMSNPLIFIVVTFIYYLVVKNGLSKYYKKKIYDLDPELKEKAKLKKEEKTKNMKDIFSNSSDKKWYSGGTVIYLILLVCIAVVFTIISK